MQASISRTSRLLVPEAIAICSGVAPAVTPPRPTFCRPADEFTALSRIAVVEGSITTPHDADRLRSIREKAKTLIAYGSCAAIGGVNGMKNNFELEDIRRYVYGDKADLFETARTLALSQVVKVDYTVYGCPVYPPEFVKILTCAVKGIPFSAKDEAVCVECKMNENECMYDRALGCLGPVTKAGCNSWCINNGNICYGCRGLLQEPVRNGFTEVLKKYNVSLEGAAGKLNMYNKTLEAEENVK